MNITRNISTDHKVLTISVNGKFNFPHYNDFRKAYENVAEGIEQYIIDLSQTSEIDTAVIGMLMVMREHINSDGHKIVIRNCNEAVLEIMLSANLDKLFIIR